MQNKKSKVSPVWFVVVFAVAVIVMLAWTSLRMLRETPTRQVTKEIPGQGWVTYTLTTNPFPPKAIELISLELVAMNRNNVALNLGGDLPYAYGEKGSEVLVGKGLAVKNGSRYHARVQFPTPGDYLLRFDMGDGNLIEFLIFVKPTQ